MVWSQKLSHIMAVSLFLFSVMMLSLSPAQAKPRCYQSSFNNGAGVSFVHKTCLAQLDQKQRLQNNQRFAQLSVKKKHTVKKRRVKRKRKFKKKNRKRKTVAKRRSKRRVRRKKMTASAQRQRLNIFQLQQLLTQENYRVGIINGRMNNRTRGSMRAYGRKFNIKNTASVGAILLHLRKNTTQLGAIPLPSAAPAATVVAALASQPFEPNVGRGEKYARQCSGCHSFKAGEGHKAGPNLHGVMGQFIGSAQQFNYSESLKFQMTMGNTWNKQELDCFLKDPQGCKPGTSMSFNGIKSANKRADLIAYLAQLGQ